MAKTFSWACAALYLTLAAAVLCSSLHMGEAAACDATSLASCLTALSSGTAPSSQCCANLRKQTPACLCSYKNNPAFGSYINSPNARRVVSACKVSYPSC
uniref:Bifunctional inhibitor/plant lipid transfer protein/seed storage helical domain-containing protein n=1 Tax=Kalanchoe fedtschenkoi TaxID=63787 RepID=A0A7N0U6X2_KALFE